MDQEPEGTWRVIGHVEVDSGEIAIIDPCYATQLLEGSGVRADALFEASMTESDALESDGRFTHLVWGQAGNFVFTDTTHGDGSFPVEARFVEIGPLSRPVELRIILVGEEEISERRRIIANLTD